MDIHIRLDEDSNEEHAKATFFINGKNTGKLIMSMEELTGIHQILGTAIKRIFPNIDTIRFSGNWNPDIANPERVTLEK